MKLHEIEISVSISFIGAWPHSTNVCGCSCSIYNSRIEYPQQRPCRLENWKHLLSAPFRKKFADPLSITLKKKKNLNCLTKRVYFSNSNSSSIRCSAPIGINGYPVYVSALLRWSPGVWGQGECSCLSGLQGRCPCTYSLSCYYDSSGRWGRWVSAVGADGWYGRTSVSPQLGQDLTNNLLSP